MLLKFGLAVLLLGLALTTNSNASPSINHDLISGWQTISEEKIKKDIAYLSSKQLTGRLALTHGDLLAIDWLAAEFKNIGLKPANGNSYLQSFNLIAYYPDHHKTKIITTHGKAKTILKEPDIYTDFYKNLRVVGEVVFAGYGITAPTLNYDDYNNIDVKDKFVLVLEHEPEERNPRSIFNGIGNTPYATNRVKALNAQAHGAIGILIAPEPNRKHPSNQQRRARIGGSTKRKIPTPAMALENDELQIPVVVLSDRAANAISGNLSLSSLQTTIDRTLTPQSQPIKNIQLTLQEQIKSKQVAQTSNVVGLLEGQDPKLKSETIIVSAHHDHNGKSGKQIWHGADDNASGTAGVIALANAIVTNTKTDSGLKPKRSILFTIFAGEEQGLLGAYYMTSHPLRPLDTTRAVINFDMIGRDEKDSTQTKGLINIPENTSNRINLIGGHFSPDYSQIVAEQNQSVGLILDDRFDSENALNTFFRSDQFPFVLLDIPAFWWFTGFHPDYHQTTDTVEKINLAKMQKIIRLAYLSTYQFANTSHPPAFIRNPKPNA